MNNPELVIMAAGMGSRYGGLKQIDTVDDYGHIIIDYSIYDAIRAGFRDVTFIIKKEIERDFREVMDKHLEGKNTLKPWKSAGFLVLLPCSKKPIALLILPSLPALGFQPIFLAKEITALSVWASVHFPRTLSPGAPTKKISTTPPIAPHATAVR